MNQTRRERLRARIMSRRLRFTGEAVRHLGVQL